VREDLNLVALGRFQVWWLMGEHLTWWSMEGSNVWWLLEGSKFGGLWKEKEKHPFHLFSLPPQQILLEFFFSLILRFYFTMILNHYFIFFLPFP
jgi:hypothetical protein